MTTQQRQDIAERAAQARADRIEFIEEQLSYGFDADTIAADLGIKKSAIYRSMYRAGRPDLARHFLDHERTRNPRRHFSRGLVCDRCGAPRANNSKKWCRKCWDSIGARAA